MANKIDLKTALDRLKRAESFLITTHIDPDGDALGSALALRFLLHALDKTAVCVACQDPVPSMYDWLPGVDCVVTPDGAAKDAELTVIVDVAQYDRIGKAAELIRKDQDVLILDHHLEDSPSGTLNFIDPSYSAASEIIVDLFELAGVPLSRDAATCAYVGLATDTGGFRFANTNANSHRHAAALVEAGIDTAEISSRCFDEMSQGKIKLLKAVLDSMEISDGGLVAYATLTEAEFEAAGATHDDINGLVNYARNIEGVRVGALFRKTGDGKVKVSLRSKDPFNSALALRPLGGGGHAGAAGATLAMTLEEAKSAVLGRIHETLKAENPAAAAQG